MSHQPFLNVGSPVDERCLLCNEYSNESEKSKTVNSEGIISLKELAVRWFNIEESLCSESPYYEFRQVKSRLSEPCEQLSVHNTCQITFRNRIKRKEAQNEKYQQSCSQADAISKNLAEQKKHRPSKIPRATTKKKQICFVCNKVSKNDYNQFNKGGLGRCSEDNAVDKIKQQMEIKLLNENDKYHEAAKRLDVLLRGACDIFALDLYYHKNCYNNFVYSYNPIRFDSENDLLEKQVINNFLKMVERRVIKDRDAFFLTELIKDISELSDECGLHELPIGYKQTSQVKIKLKETFGPQIDFYLVGNRIVVHPGDVNPLMYSIATLQGQGMREDDLTKAFASLIRRKIASREPQKWPPEPDEFLSQLDNSGPLSCIYNAIAWSIDPKRNKNNFSYVKTPSISQAEKISAISQSWEMLMTHQRPALSTALSLTLHRITGSKEAISLLHRCGVGISYTDVRVLNNTWAKTVTMQHKKMLPPGFVKGKSIHVTFDNSDGRQQTLTGAHTTHHTTGTVFQLSNPESEDNTTQGSTPIITNLIDNEPNDYGTYKIPRKKESPPSFPMFKDMHCNSPLIDEAFKRDIAWVLMDSVSSDNETGPVGSWTAFMKAVTDSTTLKCKLEYLPVVPLPPHDNVIKWYMDMIIEMANDLELEHIFVHADEAINSKMLIISWLFEGKYNKIIPLIGGFHTILVCLKIMHKKYGCLGFRDWWVDAGAIADGSVDQAIEGRHYYRSVRLHKQSFNALLRTRINKLSGCITAELLELLSDLRHHPSPETLQAVLQSKDFQELCALLTKTTGTQSQMIVEYLRDVSSMLCLISSVRENCIERHLAAERVLLPKCFAFGHMNYARYLTFQHVNLETCKLLNNSAWADLVTNGFGGSLSGEPFSTIHGDLITETTINREVKVRGGPMQGGYSTNEKPTDTFVKTSHLMAAVKTKLKAKLDILTSSVHKETTLSSRKKHEQMINSLVHQMNQYFDPFMDGAARHLKTGTEIDPTVIVGLLSSTNVGERCYKEFVEKRLTTIGEKKVSIFAKITKLNIKTGMEKVKKDSKVVNILKEDRQAFGSLVGKAATPEEAHSYPLTSIPLALATPEKDLRQGSKASLRNYLIEESDSVCDKPLKKSDWLIDGMAAIKSVPPQDTWGDYANALLKFCSPPGNTDALSIGIIFDSYRMNTAKQMTQIRRGKPGRRIYITSGAQSMPKGKDWESFLRNGENKTELISFLVGHYKTNHLNNVHLPLTLTEEEKTWLITPSSIDEIPSCNHIEADTRLILEASKSVNPVIIAATDSDILILLCYAYSCCKPNNNWMMKIDHQRYISISAIQSYFGDTLCQILPAYHSITGCDTTSFPFGIGKVKPLKKMMNLKKCYLLSNLGTSDKSVNEITAAKQFMQTIMYGGKEGETFASTRVRMYEKQKIKSSSTLIPDESSSTQHIKRSDLQTYIWKQCLKQNICQPSLDNRGWQDTDEGIKPIWFTGPQFPPCLTKVSRRSKLKLDCGYEADQEDVSQDITEPRKKKRKHDAITYADDSIGYLGENEDDLKDSDSNGMNTSSCITEYDSESETTDSDSDAY